MRKKDVKDVNVQCFKFDLNVCHDFKNEIFRPVSIATLLILLYLSNTVLL